MDSRTEGYSLRILSIFCDATYRWPLWFLRSAILSWVTLSLIYVYLFVFSLILCASCPLFATWFPSYASSVPGDTWFQLLLLYPCLLCPHQRHNLSHYPVSYTLPFTQIWIQNELYDRKQRVVVEVVYSGIVINWAKEFSWHLFFLNVCVAFWEDK